jgi:flagellar secretion chaperone FliS
MKNAALSYRQSAVRGASPVGLIVILYEEVIRALRKAQRALKQNDIEQRALELSHAIKVVGHLQSVLNFDEGGVVAKNLCNFYNAARTAILRANNDRGYDIIESLAGDFSNVAQAWQEVDRELEYSSSIDASAAPIKNVDPEILAGSLQHPRAGR